MGRSSSIFLPWQKLTHRLGRCRTEISTNACQEEGHISPEEGTFVGLKGLQRMKIGLGIPSYGLGCIMRFQDLKAGFF